VAARAARSIDLPAARKIRAALIADRSRRGTSTWALPVVRLPATPAARFERRGEARRARAIPYASARWTRGRSRAARDLFGVRALRAGARRAVDLFHFIAFVAGEH
jgi:hypothetical protein